MNNHKISAGLTLFCAISLLAASFTAHAQSDVQQTGTLDIQPGSGPPVLSAPFDFQFPRAFIPLTGTTPIYVTLDPSEPEETLQVGDASQTGGFTVTTSVSEFRGTDNPENMFSYENLSMVTLAQSLDDNEPADGGPTNQPPGAPNVSAPLFCNWDPTNPTTPLMQDECDDELDINIMDATSSVTSNLAADIDEDSDTITLDDTSAFRVPDPVGPPPIPSHLARIGTDYFTYTDVSGNDLTGVSGIGAPHTTGETVEQLSEESDQFVILENSVPGDTGSYSIGFGYRLNITPEMIADTYSGVITFTILPT
jgi:hypothetical protein